MRIYFQVIWNLFYKTGFAGGQYDNPVPHADVVTSTTHKTEVDFGFLRGGIMILKLENDDYTKKLNSAIFPGTQGGQQ